MNATLEKPVKKNKKIKTMPFPSQVHKACPNKEIRAMASDLKDASNDLSYYLGLAGNVSPMAMPHYVDTKTGTYGIESLIARVLRDNGAEFSENVFDDATKKEVAIFESSFSAIFKASAMLAVDVVAQCRAELVKSNNHPHRYSEQTIRSYLSYFMKKNKRVRSYQMTKDEDSERTCLKPRCKFYLHKV